MFDGNDVKGWKAKGRYVKMYRCVVGFTGVLGGV